MAQPVRWSVTCVSCFSPSWLPRLTSAPGHISNDRKTPPLCEEHGTSVWVSWSCHNKVLRTWWLKTTAIYSPTVLEEHSKQKEPWLQRLPGGVVRADRARIRAVGAEMRLPESTAMVKFTHWQWYGVSGLIKKVRKIHIPSILLEFLGILQNHLVPTLPESPSPPSAHHLLLWAPAPSTHSTNLNLVYAKPYNVHISRKAPTVLLWTQ